MGAEDFLSAGELRQRVSVVHTGKESDGHDGWVPNETVALRRIPAKIQPLTGRDLERARQIDPRISHEVTLRYWKNYRNDLDGGRAHIVYHDITDRTFEIVGPPIDVAERHVQLRQTCREAA